VGELLHHLLIFFSSFFHSSFIRTFYYIPTSGFDITLNYRQKADPYNRRWRYSRFTKVYDKSICSFSFSSLLLLGVFLVDRGRGREVKLVEFFFLPPVREKKEIACN